jgi:hypothetical protein
MYSGGIPSAVSAPTTEPADVPTIMSAWDGSQPVSDCSASSAPMSHDAPRTPPAKSRGASLFFLRELLRLVLVLQGVE